MKNYSNSMIVPQTQPIPTRTDMVKNNAGGYGFQVTPQELLERFLLIGSEGGTYYCSEQKLTIDNAKNVISMIQSNGVNVINTVLLFAKERRSPKVDAGIFALALCCSHGNAETKKIAYNAISDVCNTATQLFMFLANIKNLRGWSRGLRNGVAKFYTKRNADQIAYQMIKYRNRNGYSHKDCLRLSHAKAKDDITNLIFKYAVGKVGKLESANNLITAFEKAQDCTIPEELIPLINENNLTWEMIPTEMLNNKDVLASLLHKMPLFALIRNLNRFAYNDLTIGNSDTSRQIVSKLKDESFIKESKIHPITIVNSMMAYAKGKGIKGDKTWNPNQNIVDALHDSFELTLKEINTLNKSILLGVDVSGSMNDPVGGMDLKCSQIANVLAYIILKSEPNSELIWFDSQIHNPKIGRRSSLNEVILNSPSGGGTDCSLPFVYALQNKIKYDAILIFTDSETWAGARHGIELVDEYRRKINKEVKIVEIALVATYSSTMPIDKNILRICGFDSSVVDVINQFLKGE